MTTASPRTVDHRLAPMIVAMAMVALIASSIMLVTRAEPAAADLSGCTVADVGGTIFRDYDADGVRDATEPGFGDQYAPDTVTVTAYGSGNTIVGGPTPADSDGDYVFAAVGGPVRIEVTGIPAYLQPGAHDPLATGSQSTVLFADPGDCSADVGLNNPNDFCGESGVDLGITCYEFGAHTDNATAQGFVLIDEDATGSGLNVYPPGTTMDQIGATYGVAHQRTTGDWFLGAYSKRHVDYGPTGDPGTIYRVDATGASVLVSLPAGPNLHGPLPAGAAVTTQGPYFYDLQPGWPTPDPAGDPAWDDGIFDAIGAIGLGDIELDPIDNTTLYAVNLFDRTLARIDTAAGAVIGSQPIPEPGCLGGAADWRPFALGWDDATLYVGGVCSGQTNSLQSDLSAAVYSYDPIATTFSAAPVFTLDAAAFANNGCPQVANCGGEASDWINPGYYPWASDFSEFEIQYPNLTSNTPTIARNQPMLTDLEFDNGDLLLGFRDRGADQLGRNNGGTDATDPKLYTVWGGAGDLWRACHDGAGGWVLEDAGSCGGWTPASPVGPIGSANGDPANVIPDGVLYGTANNQGPGGGEYYWDDILAWTPAEWPYIRATERHSEITFGGLVQIPGREWVATNAFDLTSTWQGGVAFFDHQDGDSRRYRVFGNVPLGKAQGLGDLEAACAFAPIEIGNRVWLDTNGNGIQDPEEAPVAGVTVRLYDSLGAVVATAITNSAGEYAFVEDTAQNLSGTSDQGVVAGGFVSGEAYVIRLDNAADYAVGGPLEGYLATVPNYGGAYAGDDVSGAGLNHDVHDSDGVVGDVLGLGIEFPEAAVVHMADTDGDGVDDTEMPGVGPAGDNDHTFDFGFSTFSLGNVVFFDVDNDGVRGAGEVGIAGVQVELWPDADGDGAPDDVDGDGDSAEDPDDVVAVATTDADGLYLFDGLAPGGYVVSIPSTEWDPGGVLEGWLSSSGASVSDDDLDEVDDGADPVLAGGTVWSSTVTLGGVSEPLGEDPDNDPLTPDTNENLTVDFGFWQPAGIGDHVWIDANRNGLQDAGELPVPNVTVDLVDPATGAVLASTLTDADGLYSFVGLVPGEYRVRFDLDTLPADHLVTVAGAGDDSADSDGDPITGLADVTTLDPGEFDRTWDLGIHARDIDLVVDKTASVASAAPGGSVDWTIVVTNEGLDGDPGPVTLSDELPPFLEFVEVSGTGWTCEHNAGVVTCEWNGPLGAGASAPPIVITTMIGSTLTDELVTNLARVSSALADSTPDNDADTALVEIVVDPDDPVDDPPVDSTLPPTGVPHDGSTKLALVLVALGAVLLLASRRRLRSAT